MFKSISFAVFAVAIGSAHAANFEAFNKSSIAKELSAQ